MITDSAPTVATAGAEADALAPMLELIADIRAGLPQMRKKAAIYLPQYQNESRADYHRRVHLAPWRAEFSDALRTLSSRPFEKPVTLGPNAPEPIIRFADDSDGRGACLHTFARRLFEHAIADGCALLLVDHPPAEGLRTVKDYKDAGARPYWSIYQASSIISLRTERIGAQRQIVDVRLRERIVEPDGFGETEINQIRRLTPGRWETWRETKPTEWQLFDAGEVEHAGPVTGVTAILLRTGESIGDWACRPPLIDLAFLQVELWKALSNVAEVMEFSASPMLVAKGAQLDAASEVKVGPRACLQCGEGGSWDYVSPPASNIREIREHAKDIISDLARLAMQPTLVRPNTTATEVGLQAAKAHSALEAWALGLKDVLQTALGMTIPYMIEPDRKAVGSWQPVIDVHHDFGSEINKENEARIIVDAAKIGLLSKQVARAELLRRGLLATSTADAAAEAV